MKYRLLRHSLGVAVVVFALGLVTCGDDDDNGGSDGYPPCDPVATFDDLDSEIDIQEPSEGCADTGVEIEVTAVRYSSDFRRYELRGEFQGNGEADLYLFPLSDANGRRCYQAVEKLAVGPGPLVNRGYAAASPV